MEDYYHKVIKLQEMLRKSEEERLNLEIKFNDTLQLIKQEEEVHLKRFRTKYRKFMDEDKRRQYRNIKILEALDRIESRTSMWEAKTQKFKEMRKKYRDLLSSPPRTTRLQQEDFKATPRADEYPSNKRSAVENYLDGLSPAENYDNDDMKGKIDNASYLKKYSNLGNINSLYSKYSCNSEKMDSEKGDAFDGVSPLKTTKDYANILRKNSDVQDFSFKSDYLERPTLFRNEPSPSFLPDIEPSLKAPRTLRRLTQSEEREKAAEVKYEKPEAFVEVNSEDVNDVSVVESKDEDHSKVVIQPEEERKFEIEKSETRDVEETLPQLKANDDLEEFTVPSPLLQENEGEVLQENELVNDTDERLLHQSSVEKERRRSEEKEEPDEKVERLPEEEIQQASLIQDDGKGELVDENQRSEEIELLSEKFDKNEDEVQQVVVEEEQEIEKKQTTQLQQREESERPPEELKEGEPPLQQFEEEAQAVQQYPQYDESGQPVQQYDGNEQFYQQQYDENGQPIQQYDENGQPIQQYDQQFDANGQPYYPQCDANGQPIQQYDQQYDENGQSYSQYDENGQPIQQYDDNGQPIQPYDENGQPLQQYDENGQPLQQYGASGQPMQQYDESGQPIQQYDANGQPIQQYDENGQPIQQYDESGQPMQQYDESGQVIQQYDENGQPYSQYDENGQPLQQYYDENGQPAQQYEQYNQQQYDESGQPIQHQYEEGEPAQLSENQPDVNIEQPSSKLEEKPNVLDMLETDTESIKVESKVSNDSDFDISSTVSKN